RTTSAFALRVQSLCFLALSIFSAEYGLCTFAYLVAFEFVEARDAWRVRMNALLAPALVAILYAVLFKATDCGARGTTLYIDPTTEPGRFFSGLAVRSLTLADMVLVPFVEPFSTNPLLSTSVAAATLLVLFLPIAEATMRPARWLLTGGLLATL